MEKISVTMLTKNSALRLREVLEALESFDEVLILDTGSTDNTMEIAKEFPNVTLHHGDMKEGFGKAYNKAGDLARNDWLFSVDSDEVVTPELAAEINQTKLDPGTVYFIDRKNVYNGKWIRYCGWYPEKRARLYNRNKSRFEEMHAHVSPIFKGLKTEEFKGSMIHYSYENTEDFLKKMQLFSSLYAEQNKGKKRSSFGIALIKGLFSFIKSYFLKKGFLGGKEGFVISLYNANTTFYKYIKLAEANGTWGKTPS